jgi:CheY-like chemotaxis protein
VARQIRADPTLHTARIIAVTGFGQEDDRRRARESGFDEHHTKPVDPDELRRVLATLPAG